MSMFFGGCPLCWDKDCNCDPKAVEDYILKQARATPITYNRSTPTLDKIKRPYGADVPGYTKTVYRGMGNCVCCGETVFACTCPAPKFRQPVSGSQQDVDPGPVILVSTDGNDYSVLDKVDPRIKKLAVEGQLELPGRTDEANVYHDTRVFSATEETLTEALGPGPEQLTPENKYWIMKALWFKPVGRYQWTHPVTGDEIIWFDINTQLMMHPILEVFRAGRKDVQNEWASQQKTAVP